MGLKSYLFFILYFCVHIHYSQEQRINEILLNCINKSYQEQDVDLKKTLFNYEKYLIENKYLESNSGKSYIKLLTTFKEVGDINMEIPTAFYVEIYKISPTNYYNFSCLSEQKNNDSKDLLNEKAIQLSKKLENVKINSLGTSLDIILKTLDENDYEKPFFKTITLLAFAWSSYLSVTISRTKDKR